MGSPFSGSLLRGPLEHHSHVVVFDYVDLRRDPNKVEAREELGRIGLPGIPGSYSAIPR